MKAVFHIYLQLFARRELEISVGTVIRLRSGSPSNPCSIPGRYTVFLAVLAKLLKSEYKLRNVCLSVRPHETTFLPVDRFELNFMFEYFSKTCPENSSFVQI